jgi:hypothetical protein
MKKHLFVGALLTLVLGGCTGSSLKEPELYAKVTLEDKTGGDVYISNEYGKWRDENIVGKVLSGTKPKATILEIKEERIIDGSDEGYRFMRFRIRLDAEPFTEGWVLSAAAGFPTCDKSHKKAGTACLR